MLGYADVRVIVEFMDGVERTYEPVGGACDSPRLAGDGSSTSVLELGHKSSAGARLVHLATLPLVNVRSYRMEPLR